MGGNSHSKSAAPVAPLIGQEYITVSISPTIQYLGPLAGGQPTGGTALLLYSDGSAYIGTTKGGRRHDWGIYVDHVSGYRFHGQWADDLWHGTGRLSCSNGIVVHGEWEKGKLKKLKKWRSCSESYSSSETEHRGLRKLSSLLPSGEDLHSAGPVDPDEQNGRTVEQEASRNKPQGLQTVLSWSVEEVGGWLEGAGLGCWRTAFKKMSVDGRRLLNLSHDILRDVMGIMPFGHRTRILSAVKTLRSSVGGKSRASSPSSAPHSSKRLTARNSLGFKVTVSTRDSSPARATRQSCSFPADQSREGDLTLSPDKDDAIAVDAANLAVVDSPSISTSLPTSTTELTKTSAPSTALPAAAAGVESQALATTALKSWVQISSPPPSSSVSKERQHSSSGHCVSGPKSEPPLSPGETGLIDKAVRVRTTSHSPSSSSSSDISTSVQTRSPAPAESFIPSAEFAQKRPTLPAPLCSTTAASGDFAGATLSLKSSTQSAVTLPVDNSKSTTHDSQFPAAKSHQCTDLRCGAGLNFICTTTTTADIPDTAASTPGSPSQVQASVRAPPPPTSVASAEGYGDDLPVVQGSICMPAASCDFGAQEESVKLPQGNIAGPPTPTDGGQGDHVGHPRADKAVDCRGDLRVKGTTAPAAAVIPGSSRSGEATSTTVAAAALKRLRLGSSGGCSGLSSITATRWRGGTGPGQSKERRAKERREVGSSGSLGVEYPSHHRRKGQGYGGRSSSSSSRPVERRRLAHFLIPFEQLTFSVPIDPSKSVFRGKWLGKTVAIKVFTGKLTSVEIWYNFVYQLSELRHPNIVLILGASSLGPNVYCVVMEYISHGSLFALLHGETKVPSSAFTGSAPSPPSSQCTLRISKTNANGQKTESSEAAAAASSVKMASLVKAHWGWITAGAGGFSSEATSNGTTRSSNDEGATEQPAAVSKADEDKGEAIAAQQPKSNGPNGANGNGAASGKGDIGTDLVLRVEVNDPAALEDQAGMSSQSQTPLSTRTEPCESLGRSNLSCDNIITSELCGGTDSKADVKEDETKTQESSSGNNSGSSNNASPTYSGATVPLPSNSSFSNLPAALDLSAPPEVFISKLLVSIIRSPCRHDWGNYTTLLVRPQAVLSSLMAGGRELDHPIGANGKAALRIAVDASQAGVNDSSFLLPVCSINNKFRPSSVSRLQTDQVACLPGNTEPQLNSRQQALLHRTPLTSNEAASRQREVLTGVLGDRRLTLTRGLHGGRAMAGMGRSSESPLSLHLLLKVAKGVATALQYLSLRGMAHQNLKSSNIFIDDCFTIKVSDFGFQMLEDAFVPIPLSRCLQHSLNAKLHSRAPISLPPPQEDHLASFVSGAKLSNTWGGGSSVSETLSRHALGSPEMREETRSVGRSQTSTRLQSALCHNGGVPATTQMPTSTEVLSEGRHDEQLPVVASSCDPGSGGVGKSKDSANAKDSKSDASALWKQTAAPDLLIGTAVRGSGGTSGGRPGGRRRSCDAAASLEVFCPQCRTNVEASNVTLRPSIFLSGELNWKSPEVISSGRHFGSQATADVYALGIVLWEMLVCRIPFHQFSSSQIQVAVGIGLLMPPPIQNAPVINAFIASCLNPEPSLRPQFQEVLAKLESLYEVANSTVEDALSSFMLGK